MHGSTSPQLFKNELLPNGQAFKFVFSYDGFIGIFFNEVTVH